MSYIIGELNHRQRKRTMKTNIPTPTIERLCSVYNVLEDMEQSGIVAVSSKELGLRLGVGAHNIRKDINYLGEIGNGRAGYDVVELKQHLKKHLGLPERTKACVVGIGRLGTAILHYSRLGNYGYDVVAGFDSNNNKLETIKTDIPLFPAHEITAVVMRNDIELAVIATPAHAAQEAADRLIEGGIQGILNFAPVVLQPKTGVAIRNIDIVNEFRILTLLSHT